MAWQPYIQAHGIAPSGYFTQANPPIIPTGANPRSWKPAQPTQRMQTRATTTAAATASQIALRGDSRSPAQVDAAGGLWSRLMNTGPRPTLQQHPNAYYDPDTHQNAPGQAPYVSFTRDIGVAKGFAGQNGFVYLVRVNVGVDFNQYRGGNAQQAEVMALQGVALRDIIAVRRLANNQIEINTTFQQGLMQPAEFNQGIALLSG